jgi:hypothetical protein
MSSIDHRERLIQSGGKRTLTSPAYNDDIALRVIRAEPVPDGAAAMRDCRVEIAVVEKRTLKPIRIALTNFLAVQEWTGAQHEFWAERIAQANAP